LLNNEVRGWEVLLVLSRLKENRGRINDLNSSFIALESTAPDIGGMIS